MGMITALLAGSEVVLNYTMVITLFFFVRNKTSHCFHPIQPEPQRPFIERQGLSHLLSFLPP